MTVDKDAVLRTLFEVGGSIDKARYVSYSRDVTLTWIRFDVKQVALNRYAVFEGDKFICCGPTRSEIERRLGFSIDMVRASEL